MRRTVVFAEGDADSDSDGGSSGSSNSSGGTHRPSLAGGRGRSAGSGGSLASSRWNLASSRWSLASRASVARVGGLDTARASALRKTATLAASVQGGQEGTRRAAKNADTHYAAIQELETYEEEVTADTGEWGVGQQMGTYSRLYRALMRPPKMRKAPDLSEIFSAIQSIDHPFFRELEEGVQRAICTHLTIQEYAEGDVISNCGDCSDTFYLVWCGRVQIDVPGVEAGCLSSGSRAVTSVGPGKAFGELDFTSSAARRTERATAVKATQCLALTAEAHQWCTGFTQDNLLRQRVALLRSVDGAMLGDVPEEDLQAMAGRMREEYYGCNQVIAQQGAEVDKIFFVKSGFCQVRRQLAPKFKAAVGLYADTGGGAAPAGRAGTSPGRASGAATARALARPPDPPPPPGAGDELQLAAGPVLRRMLQQHGAVLEEGPSGGQGDGTPSAAGVRSRLGRSTVGDVAATGAAASAPASARVRAPQDEERETLAVDVLKAGRSFGVMEMMEGLGYQFTVVADPYAEVYVIARIDLLRNTSKVILHRLFCDYKARLSDDRLIERLKQKNRWNNYKRKLLDDIRSCRTLACAGAMGVIDRRTSVPWRGGASSLSAEDYARVGGGDKIWDRRAQTPPKPSYANKGDNQSQVQHNFNVSCVRDSNGAIDVIVERQQRDEAMAVLNEKLLMHAGTGAGKTGVAPRAGGAASRVRGCQ